MLGVLCNPPSSPHRWTLYPYLELRNRGPMGVRSLAEATCRSVVELKRADCFHQVTLSSLGAPSQPGTGSTDISWLLNRSCHFAKCFHTLPPPLTLVVTGRGGRGGALLSARAQRKWEPARCCLAEPRGEPRNPDSSASALFTSLPLSTVSHLTCKGKDGWVGGAGAGETSNDVTSDWWKRSQAQRWNRSWGSRMLL